MKKISSLVVLMALLITALIPFSVLAQETLTIQGSSTVLPIAQKAAEVYMENNPDVNISVRGGGSGNGIAALLMVLLILQMLLDLSNRKKLKPQ